MRQNSKFFLAGVSATNAASLTAVIDTRGFSFARLYCLMNGQTTGNSTTPTNNVLQESDTDVASNYTTIATTGFQTVPSLGTTTVSSNLARIIYDVDCRGGRKRYLRVLYTPNATGEILIAAELSEPSDGCTTAAEIGAATVGAL